MSDIKEKIAEIFSIVLELSDHEDAQNIRRINEAKWDSLAHVTLIAALESEFNIKIDYSDSERLTSYPSTVLLISEKVA